MGNQFTVIELLVQSLKGDINPGADSSPENAIAFQRPAFGFMKGTGVILGDIIAPVLPESDWEALQ